MMQCIQCTSSTSGQTSSRLAYTMQFSIVYWIIDTIAQYMISNSDVSKKNLSTCAVFTKWFYSGQINRRKKFGNWRHHSIAGRWAGCCRTGQWRSSCLGHRRTGGWPGMGPVWWLADSCWHHLPSSRTTWRVASDGAGYNQHHTLAQNFSILLTQSLLQAARCMFPSQQWWLRFHGDQSLQLWRSTLWDHLRGAW